MTSFKKDNESDETKQLISCLLMSCGFETAFHNNQLFTVRLFKGIWKHYTSALMRSSTNENIVTNIAEHN